MTASDVEFAVYASTNLLPPPPHSLHSTPHSRLTAHVNVNVNDTPKVAMCPQRGHLHYEGWDHTHSATDDLYSTDASERTPWSNAESVNVGLLSRGNSHADTLSSAPFLSRYSIAAYPSSAGAADANPGSSSVNSCVGMLSSAPCQTQEFPALFPSRPVSAPGTSFSIVNSPDVKAFTNPHSVSLHHDVIAECASEDEDGLSISDSSDSDTASDTSEDNRCTQNDILDDVRSWAHFMNLPCPTKGDRNLSIIVREAFEKFSSPPGIRDAVDWAEGYTLPHDIAERDEIRLARAGDTLSGLARAAWEASASARLNTDRVEYWNTQDTVDPLHPDWSRLRTLARDGARIVTDPNFVERSSPPPLRSTYLAVAPAVNKAMVDLWNDEFVFILSKPTVDRLIANGENIHFSPLHWVLKNGAPQGRTIQDVSAQDMREAATSGVWRALNSSFVKEAGEATYGKVSHPGTAEIVNMAMSGLKEFTFEFKLGSKRFGWISDLHQAFMRAINVHPDDVRLLAFTITDDLVVIYRVGFFGWTTFPHIFGVITRTLLRLLHGRVRGLTVGYVDDFFGPSTNALAESSLDLFAEVAAGLCGPGINNDDKRKAAEAFDALGWRLDYTKGRAVDVDSTPVPGGTLSIARKNLMKVLFHFLSVPYTFTLRRVQIERLASYMTRYSDLVLAEWRPLAHVLFREIRGLNRSALKVLSSTARIAIRLWQTVFCRAASDENFMCREILDLSAALDKPEFIVTFDGSLHGSGLRIGWWSSTEGIDGVESGPITVVSTSYTGLGWNFVQQQDSSYQNFSEFLTVTIGIVELIVRGLRNASVIIEGDSVSALTWASRRSYRSAFCLRTSLALCHAMRAANVTIYRQYRFVTGDDNTLCDPLSRNMQPLDDWLGIETGDAREWIPATMLTSGRTAPWIAELLAICNPENPLDSDEDWAEFLARLNPWIALVTTTPNSDTLHRQQPPTATDDIQVFVSAPIRRSTQNAKNASTAWTLRCPRTLTVLDLCTLVATHYSVTHSHIRLAISSLRRTVHTDCGANAILTLTPGDMLHVVAALKGAGPRQKRAKVQMPTIMDLTWSSSTSQLALRQVVGQGIISQSDIDRLARIRPVAESTDTSYAHAWKLWHVFLTQRQQLYLLLLQHGTHYERKALVATFVLWLHDTYSYDKTRISGLLSGIRSAFLRLGEDASLFADDYVRTVLSSTRAPARVTSIRRMCSHLRVPAPPVLLYDLRLEALSHSATTIDNQRAWGICLSSTFLFNFGARYSNVGIDTAARGKHTIRRMDVVVQCINGHRYSVPDFYRWLHSKGYLLGGEDACIPTVDALIFYLHSSKVHKIEGRVEVLSRSSLSDVTVAESYSPSAFLDDMVRWIFWTSGAGSIDLDAAPPCARYNGNSPLFARMKLVWSAHKRVEHRIQRLVTAQLHRSDMTASLRRVGVQRGIPATHLSTHSLKIGGITSMTAAGETLEATRRFGGHAVNSTSTFLYQRDTGREIRPLLLASVGRGLQVTDITRVLPLRPLSLDDSTMLDQMTPLCHITDRGNEDPEPGDYTDSDDEST